ncbi:MAG: radical SAM protein [Acidobacteria bacterium]|nr:radical SAM protein [Acidobacteriota bacterium]
MQVHPGTRELPRRLKVVLIRTSKYDDEGYVIRHLRGVLPSNTLACLYSLTEHVRERKFLGEETEIEIELYDESVHRVPVQRILRANRKPGQKVVVGLVGVQTNQFPRASDLAKRFRSGGVTVIIGGFHVSGTLAMFHQTTPEIQELIDLGVSVAKGEVEENWGIILRDALHDRLQPIYDTVDDLPDLFTKPIPMVHRGYLKKFASSNFGTIDCGRGCPFNCSFCTIINVQGHKVRYRSADGLAHALRENYRLHGIDFYFFTDDDFARNSGWREIFEMLIKLREEDGIRIQFMMQVDTLSYKIPQFVELASRAGCSQVFIGMESINPKTLKAAGKTQNHVEQYKDLIAAWHNAKAATHVGYIIGFPLDNADSVAQDVERLKSEMKVDQASFFMLTPLPGSRDHFDMVRAGEYMDQDLNRFDSFHETTHHPNFRAGEWFQAYRSAWKSFYSFEYMREVLAGANPENYWNIFRNFIWYKNAALNEGGHPMLHGFFRLKDRTDRRRGYPVESRLRHFVRRFREIRDFSLGAIHLLLEMEELWLQTRKRSEAELRVVSELKRIRAEARRNLRVAELQLAHVRAKAHIPEIHVPSRLSLLFKDFNLAVAQRVTYSREDLKHYWINTKDRLRRGQIFLISPHRFLINLYRDVQLFVLFLAALMRANQRQEV